MHSKADRSQLSLPYGSENKNRKIREKLKRKTDMIRTNGSGQVSLESVLREEKSLYWEGFVKQVGFKPGVKE